MLRDSHSYETQIIDAVRSVNRALGGSYGSSSAIYKSEFNQYEVQLIDAIKGIGRTLSGKGLSLSGAAGGGASSEELQRLSQRVTKLENESFFRLVDGNVTLKPEYQNLWVPGWLAAGGIGTGSGGGGTSYLRELLDIYHDDNGILRGNGDPVANGDILVYDNTTDPDNPRWIAAASSAAGAVTNYGDSTTGRIATVGSVDIYNGVKWGSAGQTANTFTLTINGVTKTVALDGYGGGGSGGGYIGTTPVQASAAAQDLTGVLSINATSAITSPSLIEWDNTNQAWHFYGNLYADGWVAAGGIGSGGGGGGGTDLASVWNSLTNATPDIYAETKINASHLPPVTTSMITDLEQWINGKGFFAPGFAFTLRTPVTATAANGTLLGVDALSNGASSSAGSDNSRIEWDSTNGAWHVFGNLYADGWVAAGGPGTGGGGTIEHLYNIGDVTLTDPTNGQALIYRNGEWVNESLSSYTLPIASASVLGGIKVGSGLSINSSGVLSASGGGASYLSSLLDVNVTETYAYDGYVLTYDHSNNQYILTAKGGSISTLTDTAIQSPSAGQALVYRNGYWRNETIQSGGSGTVTSVGLSMPSCFSVSGSPVTGSGTLSVSFASQTRYSVLAAPSTGNGTPSFRALVAGDIPDLSGKYVTLDTTQNNISGAKTFTTNPVTIAATSGLSVNASSYIDIGNARLVFDSGANALHITKRSGTSATIGLFADGFVAAGGVSGQSSVSYVDLESNQSVGGRKTFTAAATFSAAMSLSSTLNVNGVTLTGSSSLLSVNKNTRFTYATGKTITISDIVDRIVALENS